MTEQRKLTHKIAPVILALAAAAFTGACSDSDDKSDSKASSTTVQTSSSTTTSSAAATSSGSIATSVATSVAPGTPSAILAATPWETTSAKDEKGGAVPLDDDKVKNYVGYAYYAPDGTFTMFTLDDKPKMQGDWSVSPDGKTRTLVAKDADGKEQSRREVEIVTLTDQDFTYRVHPDSVDKSKYYDIVHTPTDHPKPAN
ncbi:DUF4822 domain-containing protein [Nocardia sp. NPDC058640]|uniref:DUF4822 domain-containing protein n=1 Tax=Nocardia sp. NPDC058640 TaxID=3346571 RepID=UPI00364BF110